MTDIAYETQLRDCIRDAMIMIDNEIVYCATGKHPGKTPMRDVLGQWKSLARDMRNLLNRETNSYGDKL
jgi:hypothetical protein